MKLSDLGEDKRLQEAYPPAPGATPGAPPAPGAAPPLGQNPQLGQQPDPAAASLALKQKQLQKKQLQDQIRATEAQLQNLRKQLGQIQ